MFKHSLKIISISILLAICEFACVMKGSLESDPKARLTEYISKSFSIKSPQDRAQLIEFLTGESKSRLAAWSDEQFRQAFMDSKRQFLKLVFKEIKLVSPTETTITYELTYLDQNRGHNAKVTNKKFCHMLYEHNRWYISDARNIKELVEYQDEMSLP